MNKRDEILKDILKISKTSPHGRFLLAPRIGKTKIAISLIKRDKPDKILWVTPSTELVEKGVPEEFIKWRAKKYLERTKIITWKSLPNEIGYYDTIILDEEQSITEVNSETLISGKLRYGNIISMTGVPTQKKDKNELYKSLGLDIIYKIDINEAVDAELLSNYNINVVEEPYDRGSPMITSMQRSLRTLGPYQVKDGKLILTGKINATLDMIKSISREGNALYKLSIEGMNQGYLTLDESYGKIQTRHFRYTLKNGKYQFHTGNTPLKLFNNIKSYRQKVRMAKALFYNLTGRTMVFCGSIDIAESISENTYHSKTDAKDLYKFMEGTIDKIALVEAGGTGFTYKGVDNLIIMQAGSDKNGITSQKICRALLKQPDYKATIWILCLKGTEDESWIKSTLSKFDSSKVNFVKYEDLKKIFLKNFKDGDK